MLDYHFVRRAIGSHNPVAIVHAHSVITQGLTEQISQPSTRFRQNGLRPAGVPLLCARRKMQIEIRLLFGNQANLYAYRSAPRFVLEAERPDDALHARTAMRTT